MEAKEVVPIKRGILARKRHKDILNDEHPHGPSGIEKVHGIFVQFSQVEGVNAFFSSNQNMLIMGLGMDPRGRAIDLQRASIENLHSIQLLQVIFSKNLSFEAFIPFILMHYRVLQYL